MKCSKCGKSDKSLEVFHVSKDFKVVTCIECYGIEDEELWWECKYCGENETPGCHQCVREDGKPMTDELCEKGENIIC